MGFMAQVGTVTIETWWDRHSQNFISQMKDRDGYQIGNAEYCGCKEHAVIQHQHMLDYAKKMFPSIETKKQRVARLDRQAREWADHNGWTIANGVYDSKNLFRFDFVSGLVVYLLMKKILVRGN